MKKCCKCKETLPFSRFGKNKTKKDGYQTACKECKKEYHKEGYDQDYQKARMVEYRLKNKEKTREYGRKYRSQNLDKIAAKTAKRKATKLQATPEWLTEEHLDDIKSMYTLAKKFEGIFGLSYHVDHIVPLQGENVCGLHVPWNLQLLEAKLNLSKSNKTTTQTSL